MGVSSWNYRIVKRKRGEEYQYELVEAYYTDGVMDGYTDEPAVFVGETAMDVINSILRAVTLQSIVDEDCQEIETIFGGRPKERKRKRDE